MESPPLSQNFRSAVHPKILGGAMSLGWAVKGSLCLSRCLATRCALEVAFREAPSPRLPYLLPCTPQNLQVGVLYPYAPSLHGPSWLVISVSPLNGELQRAETTSRPIRSPVSHQGLGSAGAEWTLNGGWLNWTEQHKPQVRFLKGLIQTHQNGFLPMNTSQQFHQPKSAPVNSSGRTEAKVQTARVQERFEEKGSGPFVGNAHAWGAHTGSR